MAYGKDKAVLQNTGSFRQRANAYSQRQGEQRRKGGGGAPFFVNQYKPPKDSDPDTIRILEGHYKVLEARGDGDAAEVVEVELPFYPCTEHFDARNQKSCLCSAGPFAGNKKKAKPCHGCEIYWSSRETGADGKKKSGRMSKQDKFVFSTIDYGNYHKMPQVDRTTGQINKADDGTPYYNWVKCVGVGCDGCKAQVETVSGQTKHWSMGWGHYNKLLSADEDVGKSCVSCGGWETITGRAWVCPNCGDGIVDLHTTSLKKDQVKETVEREFHCNCGFKGFLSEIIECKQCTPLGGTAKRATIFDVDMQVKRVSSSQGGNDATDLVIVRTSPPRPVDKRFENLKKPLALEKIYAPTPIETQATQFGVTTTNRQPRTTGDISSGAAMPPPGAFVPQGVPPMGPPPEMPGFGPPGGFPQQMIGVPPQSVVQNPVQFQQPPAGFTYAPPPAQQAPGFAPPQTQWPGLIPPKQ